jgi:polygalacturonase
MWNVVMQKLVVFTALATLNGAALAADTICDVRGDGTLQTAIVQKALNDCAGKGVVRLTGEKVVSAPLLLRSHTILEIMPGTILEGSQNHNDYPNTEIFRRPGRQPLLLAKDAVDITIRGGGTIDGRGESWWPLKSVADLRPRLIIFDHVRHVLMENITVKDSPSWQIVPYYSEDLTFRNMTITAPAREGHNTDGIDPFSSKHILIDHVTIDTGDDNVAIKSGQPGSPGPDSPSEDIRIVDCVFLHGHGLSIGSEVAGGVRNVLAERLSFDGTDQGIRVKSGRDRGNDIGNLVFRNITMKNVGTAIMLTEYYGAQRGMNGANATPAPITGLTPRYHDITFQNITVESAKSAMLIDGLPEMPIRSVTLNNVRISSDAGATIRHAVVEAHQLVVDAKAEVPIAIGPGAQLTHR